MDCKQFRDAVMCYLDDDMDESSISEFDAHKQTCDKCEQYLEDVQLIKNTMQDFELEPLPDNFEIELHEKLIKASHEREESTDKKNKTANTNDKNVGIVSYFYNHRWLSYTMGTAAVLFIAIMMIGMGGIRMGSSDKSIKMDAGYDTDDGYYEENMAEAAPMAFGAIAEESVEVSADEGEYVLAGEAKSSERKSSAKTSDDGYMEGRLLIRSAAMTLEVENYDDVFKIITDRVNAYGGFIGSSDTSLTHRRRSDGEGFLKEGMLVVRVPQEQFDNALAGFKTLGNQIYINISSEDITNRYRDVAEEVENLKVRERKLREIMEQAQTVEDTIVVERELSDVRGSINRLSGDLKNWERLVAMSSIHINLNEVRSLTPKIEPIDDSFGARIKEGFVDSINYMKYRFEELTIRVVEMIPWIIVYGIILFVLYKIVRFIVRFFKRKSTKVEAMDTNSHE